MSWLSAWICSSVLDEWIVWSSCYHEAVVSVLSSHWALSPQHCQHCSADPVWLKLIEPTLITPPWEGLTLGTLDSHHLLSQHNLPNSCSNTNWHLLVPQYVNNTGSQSVCSLSSFSLSTTLYREIILFYSYYLGTRGNERLEGSVFYDVVLKPFFI